MTPTIDRLTKPRKPRAPKSAVTLAAHRRTVEACRLMGIPYKRPDHPSVKRLLADFQEQSMRRKDASLRRLIDLWRETTPKPVGLLDPHGWDDHRCSQLGSVPMPLGVGDYAVIVCKYHRRRPPRLQAYARTVGADWLRANLPSLWEGWRMASYRKQEAPAWRLRRPGGRPAPEQPYLRVRSYTVPQVGVSL